MLSEINSFKAIINIDFFFSNVLPLTYATAHDLLPSCQDYCEEGLGFFYGHVKYMFKKTVLSKIV